MYKLAFVGITCKMRLRINAYTMHVCGISCTETKANLILVFTCLCFFKSFPFFIFNYFSNISERRRGRKQWRQVIMCFIFKAVNHVQQNLKMLGAQLSL